MTMPSTLYSNIELLDHGPSGVLVGSGVCECGPGWRDLSAAVDTPNLTVEWTATTLHRHIPIIQSGLLHNVTNLDPYDQHFNLKLEDFTPQSAIQKQSSLPTPHHTLACTNTSCSSGSSKKSSGQTLNLHTGTCTTCNRSSIAIGGISCRRRNAIARNRK